MDSKFETEGPSLVYLLTCIIKRGKGLELSRKGGRWDVGRKRVGVVRKKGEWPV